MIPGPAYRDRSEAGRILGARVAERIGRPDEALVLALPRGGVPVGREVARALEAPLDVFVVRKLGVPGQEELAMGAIASGGSAVRNEAVIAEFGITERAFAAVAGRELAEVRRRERLYRALRPPAPLRGCTVVLVDDGLATGFTLRAAVAAVRERGPARIVAAVPVGAPDTCAELAGEVDLLVCPFRPSPFQAVGIWYWNFSQTSDEEVREAMAGVAHERAAGAPRS